MTKAPKHRLLILDDHQMTQLLRNPNIVARFPFMRMASQAVQNGQKVGCVPCQPTPAAATVDLSGIRAAIDSMGQADKDALKSMLSADRVRVYYKNHRGQTFKSTF